MAIITNKKETLGGTGIMVKVVSGLASVSTSDTVDLTLPDYYTHCYLGVKMYDVAGNQIQAGVATGTFTVASYTANTGLAESPPSPAIDASAPSTIDWGGNTERVVVSASALTGGVATWKVTITFNRS